MSRARLSPARRRAALPLALLTGALFGHAAQAQEAASAPAPLTDAAPAGAGLSAVTRLRVADPFLELHTGPGRGYPVFFVVARDEWVSIELRHTDWYKLRAEGGQLGWVHRSQLAGTLGGDGRPAPLREVLLDDYLRRRVEAGASYGRLQGEPVLRLWAGYRLSDALRAEATLSQVQGTYSGSNLWQLGLVVEPWFDQRLSPFFGIGLGRFNNVPNKSLVDNARTDAAAASATLGLRYHLSDRFVLRLDATLHNVYLGDTRSAEYRAFTGGLSFFF